MIKTNHKNYQPTPYVGDFISEVRRNKRITQEQLADFLDVEYSRLGKWERGVHKFPVDMLPLVAQALGEDIVFTAAGEIKIGNGAISMQTLKTVLNSESIKRVVEQHVLVLNDGVSKVFNLVEEGVAKECNNACLLTEIMIDGELKSFENHLYVNGDQSLYLLESRLFDVKTDRMEGVYLELLYPDLTIYEDEVDDVWSFGDWELVE